MSAHDVLARSRAKQGLPPTLEDDDAIERLAMLLEAGREDGAPKDAVLDGLPDHDLTKNRDRGQR